MRERTAASSPEDREPFFLPGPPRDEDTPRRLLTMVVTGDPVQDFFEFLNQQDSFAKERRLFDFLFANLPLLAVAREIEEEQAA
jgi:hypothetical protein